MKIVILRSVASPNGEGAGGDYRQKLDTRYADRVIGNLVGDDSFCTSCGDECIYCRRPYDRRFGDDIVRVVELPSVLPHVLEEPAGLVPEELPAHDVLLAIAVHEQILLETMKRCAAWGTRGIVVPREAPDWLSGAAKAQAQEIAERAGIEIAFPKPFCSFDPPRGGVLAEFRDHFHIGKPEVEIVVEDGVIKEARVKSSAPCGATYYIARWLVGHNVEDDVKYGVVSKRLHSYPCTASMEWDEELNETALHVSGDLHYGILRPLGREVEKERRRLVTTTGVTLPEPIPFDENRQQIERARQAILDELEKTGQVSLESLKGKGIPPAAVYTAVLALKNEGKVRTEGQVVIKAGPPGSEARPS